MWTILKIIGEIVIFFGFLYGLHTTEVISLETAITIGVISVVFILCYQEQKKFLDRIINPIKLAIIEMQTIFKQDSIDLTYKLTETSESPLKPTQYGARLIKESGLEKILNENKPFLIDEIRKLLPKDYTDYDVQEMSRQALLSLKNNPILNSVKEYSFKKGMDIDIILNTGGLWLKDDFLGKPRKTAEK